MHAEHALTLTTPEVGPGGPSHLAALLQEVKQTSPSTTPRCFLGAGNVTVRSDAMDNRQPVALSASACGCRKNTAVGFLTADGEDELNIFSTEAIISPPPRSSAIRPAKTGRPWTR